ncbi:hypothetical protein Fmac_008102 [Flemingia macrophylla]|uniref:Uncharacterized protein n=1 Tax=Flemingia macrophylla TaxID=520843 RepID=A0ABD1MWH1_9FABA
MEEKMVNMATELATVKSQVQTLLSYIALKEGGNIPEEMAALFHTSMHQAADVGSGTRTGTESISPTNMRKSSGGSNVDLEPSQRSVWAWAIPQMASLYLILCRDSLSGALTLRLMSTCSRLVGHCRITGQGDVKLWFH